MKLQITITTEIEVAEGELEEFYEATTIEEAAKNQETWFNDGTADVIEWVCGGVSFTTKVDGIPE